MTSTLQQEASRKLRLSSQQTMRVAQRLYENGFITYMRTDSTTLSDSALDRCAGAGGRALRRRCDSGRAAPVRAARQERAGGPRGDPAGGRPLPDARRGAAPALGRGAEPLRADLEAHGRLADGGRPWPDRLGPDRLDGGRRQARRVRDRGHRDHVPRLPARLRGGPRRAGDRRRGEAAAAVAGGPVADGDGARARRARDLAAGALHRGDAREGARGARHRPAVDLRGDHGHDPRPRLRPEAGPGAGAGVPRVRGRQPARAALLEARRLRVHRADGGRPRPDRRRRRGAHGVAAALLLRRQRATRDSSISSRTSARSTRARSTRSRSGTESTCASAGTGRTWSARGSGRRCRRGSLPTS